MLQVEGRCRSGALASSLRLLASALLLLTVAVTLPRHVQQSTVSHRVNSSAPLDAYVLLDASGSVTDVQWDQGLQFTRSAVLALNSSLASFRAGLGQFATDFRTVFNVSSDLTPFAALPSGVQRIIGYTRMEKGLCGNDFATAGCTGGAFGELQRRKAPARDAPGCRAPHPKPLVLLVTDGAPNDPKATFEAAKFLKSRNVTIAGVLVKYSDEAPQADLLYGLSSCCPEEEMAITPAGFLECRLPRNQSCPFMFTAEDYSALVRQTATIAASLAAEMLCFADTTVVSGGGSYRKLWYLLLMLPAALQLLWHQVTSKLSSLGAEGHGNAEEPVAAAPVGEASSATQAFTSQPIALHVASEPAPVAIEEPHPEVPAKPPAPAPVPRPVEEDEGGYHGRKWAPVRHCYLVNGRPVDVDYGHAKKLPPTAPNRARRGCETSSQLDTPEGFFASLAKGEGQQVKGVTPKVSPKRPQEPATELTRPSLLETCDLEAPAAVAQTHRTEGLDLQPPDRRAPLLVEAEREAASGSSGPAVASPCWRRCTRRLASRHGMLTLIETMLLAAAVTYKTT